MPASIKKSGDRATNNVGHPVVKIRSAASRRGELMELIQCTKEGDAAHGGPEKSLATEAGGAAQSHSQTECAGGKSERVNLLIPI